MTQLLQLIYTSCPRGLTGGPGLQTFSMSPGITDDERREIELVAQYVPPMDLAGEPDPQTIKRLFPVAFSFFRLQSGRYGVCRTCYTGRDYSGRWGNYFSHVLIVAKGMFPVSPMRLHESPLFRSHLDPGEKSKDGPPEPLPALHLKDEVIGAKIWREVVSFMKPSARRERLADLLSLVIRQKNIPRVILRTDSAESPYWIGAVMEAFSVELAHLLTFTTYHVDPPATHFALAATSRSGSRFNETEAFMGHGFSIFDPADKKRADSRLSEFAEQISAPMGEGSDLIEQWRALLNRLSIKDIDARMDVYWLLFRMLNGYFDTRNPDRLAEALDVAEEHPDIKALLSGQAGELAEAADLGMKPESALGISRFLFNAVGLTQDREGLDTVYRHFFNTVYRLIFEEETCRRDIVLEMNGHAWLLRGNYFQDHVRRCCKPEQLARLEEGLTKDGRPERAVICLDMTVGNLAASELGWAEAEKIPGLVPLVKSALRALLLSENDLPTTLSTLSAKPDYLAAIVVLAAEMTAGSGRKTGSPAASDMLARVVTDVLSGMSTDDALHTRRLLANSNLGGLLFKEFLILLHASSREKGMFWDYHRQVFAGIDRYRREYLSFAVGQYMDKAEKRIDVDEGMKLLSLANELDDREVMRIVAIIERQISLGPPRKSVRLQVERIHQIKVERDIRTRPDMTGLLALGIGLDKAARTADLDDSAPEPFPDLQGISEKDHNRFLDWVLPSFMAAVTSAADHRRLLGALSPAGFPEDLAERYLRYFSRAVERSPDPLEAWQEMFLFLSRKETVDGAVGLEVVRQSIQSKLPSVLAKIPPAVHNELTGRLMREPELNSDVILEIMDETQKKRERSLGALMRRLFGRKS
jgi:hypothetical protein